MQVYEDNAPALALYRKLGFEPVTLPALEAEQGNDVAKIRTAESDAEEESSGLIERIKVVGLLGQAEQLFAYICRC